MNIFMARFTDDTADISYRFIEQLRARYGAGSVLLEQPGDMRSTIARCKVIVMVIGPDWAAKLATDSATLATIAAALTQEKLIVPLLVNGGSMPHPSTLSPVIAPLAYRQAFTLRGDPYFFTDIQAITQQIDTQLGWRPASAPILVSGTLASFAYVLILGLAVALSFAGGDAFHIKDGWVAAFAIVLVVMCVSYVYALGAAIYRAIRRKKWIWFTAVLGSLLLMIASSAVYAAIAALLFPITSILLMVFGLWGPRRQIA